MIGTVQCIFRPVVSFSLICCKTHSRFLFCPFVILHRFIYKLQYNTSKNTGKFQMVLPFKSSGSSRSLPSYDESVTSTSNSNNTTLDVDNFEKRGRKRYKVWDHFTKDDKGRAECKYCTKDVPARTNESMKKHLLNCSIFKSSGHKVSEIFPELQQKSLQRI